MSGRAPSHQRVGWFELFYDLVIVAAVSYTGHTFAEHPSWALGAWIAAWTLIMFVLWLLTSLHSNLFPGDRPVERLLGLLQMLALVVAALGTVADEGLSNATGFGALAVAFGTVAALYLLPHGMTHEKDRSAGVLGISAAAACLVLLLGLFLPEDAEWTLNGFPPWILTAGVIIPTLALFVVLGRRRFTARLDHEHLGERLGQLVIIILGEAFLSLVAALGGLSSIPNPVFFVLTFLVVFAIWTVYFSSVMPAGVPVTRIRSWLLAHWLLMFGAVGAAAGFSSLTLVPWGASAPSQWTTMPLAFVMAALAALTWLSSGAMTVLVRVHLLAAAVLVVISVVEVVMSGAGGGWLVAVGSLIVMADALFCALVERPYSQVSPAAEATRSPGSGPSPS